MYYDEYTNLSDRLIAFLFSCRSTRLYFQIINERAFKRRNKESIRVTLYKLKKNGLISEQNGRWRLTEMGKRKGINIQRYSFISSPFPPKSPERIILAYDISEKMRYERHWLRSQIKIFGYRMLQQSLWIGPGPLPAEFQKKIKEIGISHCVKIFAKK